MWRKELLFVVCCVMWAESSGAESKCERREKSSISLEIAENIMGKMKEIIPDCPETSTNKTECGVKAKLIAYLDIANKLITHARKNYPTCIDDGNKDRNITDPVTTESNNLITEEPSLEYPRDCSEVLRKGLKDSGVYTIWIGSSSLRNRTIQVFCDMKTDGGGWTVIQRRGNFTPQEDFYRGWNDYREGFGNIGRDFWLGNDNIFILSNQRKYQVRFDLESAEGETEFALYETFRINNEVSQYRLFIGRYIDGNAGDSMTYHNGRSFFTKDRDNGCAQERKGGWWYYTCGNSNLNGPYNPGAKGGDGDFIYWYHWKKVAVGLAGSEIKIRPMRSSRKTLS